MEKLEHRADDLKVGIERDIRDMESEIKTTKREARQVPNLEQRIVAQRQVKELERKLKEVRTRRDEARDEALDQHVSVCLKPAFHGCRLPHFQQNRGHSPCFLAIAHSCVDLLLDSGRFSRYYSSNTPASPLPLVGEAHLGRVFLCAAGLYSAAWEVSR